MAKQSNLPQLDPYTLRWVAKHTEGKWLTRELRSIALRHPAGDRRVFDEQLAMLGAVGRLRIYVRNLATRIGGKP